MGAQKALGTLAAMGGSTTKKDDPPKVGVDVPMQDTSETVYVSPLALLKHGRAGVPMESWD